MCPVNYLRMLYQKLIEVRTGMLNDHPFWPRGERERERDIHYI